MIIHHEGFIVTNAHVVEDASKVTVVLADGRELPAQVINASPEKDLAILKVDSPNDLPVVELGTSSDLMIGETVIAIGNPYGYANTVTSGVISALGRDIQVDEDRWLRGLIQTDAPINPGNSGGPLFNVLGQVIGINTAIRAQAENIGFAIPVDALISSLSQMLMPENLRRVRLGLVVGPASTGKAIVVQFVVKGSPADRQGIRPGDIIQKIDGNDLTSVVDFYVKLMHKQAGEPILVGYTRPSQQDLRVARLTMEPRPLPDGAALARSWFGMSVSELTSRLARKYGYDRAYPVIIITAVNSGSQADEIGLRPGDLIVRVNGNPVRDMNEFSLEMEKVAGQTVQFEVLRITESVFGLIQRRYIVEMKAGSQSEPL
jgi:serine protease Do